MNIGNRFLELVQDDGQSLIHFESESWDAITSSFGIALFPNIKCNRSDGWDASFCILKPNGILLASFWKGGCQYLDFLDHFNRHRGKKNKSIDNPHKTEDGFRYCLQKSGFKSVSISEVWNN